MKFYKLFVKGYGVSFYCPFCKKYHSVGEILNTTCEKGDGLVVPVDFSTEIYQYKNGDIVGYVASINGELYAFATDEFIVDEYLHQFAQKCKLRLRKILEGVVVSVNKIHERVEMYIEDWRSLIACIEFIYDPKKDYVFRIYEGEYANYDITLNVVNLNVDKAIELLTEEINKLMKN